MSATGGAIKAQPWNDPHAKPYVQVDHITNPSATSRRSTMFR
jgi:hypothetical protein